MLNFKICQLLPTICLLWHHGPVKVCLRHSEHKSVARLSDLQGLSSKKVKCIPHVVLTATQKDVLNKDSDFRPQSNNFQKYRVAELRVLEIWQEETCAFKKLCPQRIKCHGLGMNNGSRYVVAWQNHAKVYPSGENGGTSLGNQSQCLSLPSGKTDPEHWIPLTSARPSAAALAGCLRVEGWTWSSCPSPLLQFRSPRWLLGSCRTKWVTAMINPVRTEWQYYMLMIFRAVLSPWLVLARHSGACLWSQHQWGGGKGRSQVLGDWATQRNAPQEQDGGGNTEEENGQTET